MAQSAQKQILITGATGFVGSWLLEELQNTLPDTRLFGTTHSDQGSAIPGVTLLPCNIAELDSVVSVVKAAQPDYIVHLAGIASAAGTDASKLREINADAAVNILRAVTKQGKPCRVLFASSGYVYGTTNPGQPAQESDPLHAQGAYAESKVAMEEAVTRFIEEQKTKDISVILARAFNHTGPRQTDAFVVPAFAKQIARIEAGLESPVVRTGNLEALRDFLHVRDVVRAYRLLLSTDLADTVTTVNVASGVGVKIQAMLDELVTLSSAEVSVETDPARLRASDLPECIGDYAKLNSLTGWTPTTSLKETLQDTLDWWRSQTN